VTLLLVGLAAAVQSEHMAAVESELHALDMQLTEQESEILLTERGFASSAAETEAAAALEHHHAALLELHAEKDKKKDSGSGRGRFWKYLPATIRVSSFYTNVTVGGQQIEAIFDTGSAEIAILAAGAAKDVCVEKANCYDPKKSKTWKAFKGKTRGGDKQYEYSSAGMVASYGRDTVKVGPLTIKKQSVGLVKEITRGRFPASVFGLGFPSLSLLPQQKTFVQNVKKGQLLRKNRFAFFFSNVVGVSSSAQFGTTNPALYSGPITWVPNVLTEGNTKPHYWQTTLNHIFVGDGLAVAGCTTPGPDGPTDCTAIFDTGSSLMIGPVAGISSILAQIKIANNGADYDCSTAALNKLPTISFDLGPMSDDESSESSGSFRFDLEPRFYMKSLNGLCTPLFASHVDERWVFGATFLRRYYSIFDYDNKRIGFARSINTRAFSSQDKKHYRMPYLAPIVDEDAIAAVQGADAVEQKTGVTGADSLLGGGSSSSGGSTTTSNSLCSSWTNANKVAISSCLTTTKVTASPDTTRTTTTAVLKVTPFGSKNQFNQQGCTTTRVVCVTNTLNCAAPTITTAASC